MSFVVNEKNKSAAKALPDLPGFTPVQMLLQKAVIAALLPPHTAWKLTLSNDGKHNRWLVSNKIMGRLSRSWSLRGDLESGLMVAKCAWQQHEDYTGVKCIHPCLESIDPHV